MSTNFLLLFSFCYRFFFIYLFFQNLPLTLNATSSLGFVRHYHYSMNSTHTHEKLSHCWDWSRRLIAGWMSSGIGDYTVVLWLLQETCLGLSKPPWNLYWDMNHHAQSVSVHVYTETHRRPALRSGVSTWVTAAEPCVRAHGCAQCIHTAGGLLHDTPDTLAASVLHRLYKHNGQTQKAQVLEELALECFRGPKNRLLMRCVKYCEHGKAEPVRETWNVCLSSLWEALWLQNRQTARLTAWSQILRRVLRNGWANADFKKAGVKTVGGALKAFLDAVNECCRWRRVFSECS